ncbi:ABC transporter ATP-binding protein [Bacillus sp. FJAT-47783]|uniref:ABC transporter ATP-binding protein n=1 Tax=Bacillus sp. FJAT-47783 TaxID=2922712 RepID=UPI001FAC9ABD
MKRKPILQVDQLKVSFTSGKKNVPAVQDVNFSLYEGEILGIVGESGSGKSVTSLSIMGLIPKPPGVIENGQILFDGEDLLKANEKRMREIRGNKISMIFQEPMTSLNPLFTIGNQLMEALLLHTKATKKEARQRSIELLKLVGLPRANELIHEYPHQLSGGMRQRVMIAMAMACHPKVLIADEPTTALDVTIQEQILSLMKDLNEKTKTSIILITHDLGVVAEVCDRVLVMYAGEIVEQGDVQTIFREPKHPYTKGLLKSIPNINKRENRLYSIPGNVPRPGTIKQGCLFAPRCEEAMDRCFQHAPSFYSSDSSDHFVRCLLHESKEGGLIENV